MRLTLLLSMEQFGPPLSENEECGGVFADFLSYLHDLDFCAQPAYFPVEEVERGLLVLPPCVL